MFDCPRCGALSERATHHRCCASGRAIADVVHRAAIDNILLVPVGGGVVTPSLEAAETLLAGWDLSINVGRLVLGAVAPQFAGAEARREDDERT